MPSGPIAHGADDNASGSVAVLVAARLLASRDFAYTIRFVLFTGEEQGLRGSAAHAARCAARGENIQGVLNLDMIAYNSDGQPIIDLYGYSGVAASLELTRVFSDVIGVYALDLDPDRFSSGWPIWASDQWSFLQQGYPAFLAIEDMGDSTPAYHQVGDRLSTLNLDYYADFTRAAVATIAHLGRRLEIGVLSGTASALDTGHPMSGAVVGTLASSWQHSFIGRTDAGGAYCLTLPIGSYTVTVQPGSAGYYSVVTAQVPIVSNTVTVLDVALEPWPRVLCVHLPWIGRE